MTTGDNEPERNTNSLQFTFLASYKIRYTEESEWLNKKNTTTDLEDGTRKDRLHMLSRLRAQAVCGFLLKNEFLIVHYAASSLDNGLNGNQRICSVSILRYPEDNQFEFSLVKAAEKLGISASDVSLYIDKLEFTMLSGFIDFIRRFPYEVYVYYSYGEEYGIDAIIRRARRLGVPDADYAPARTVNLYFLSWPFFDGQPPRSSIEILFRRNRILPKDFLTGLQESEKFGEKRYGEICRSTNVKTRMFLHVIVMMKNRKLISPNKSFLIRMLENAYVSILSLFSWIYEHPLRKGAAALFLIVTFLLIVKGFFAPDFEFLSYLRNMNL